MSVREGSEGLDLSDLTVFSFGKEAFRGDEGKNSVVVMKSEIGGKR